MAIKKNIKANLHTKFRKYIEKISSIRSKNDMQLQNFIVQYNTIHVASIYYLCHISCQFKL